MANSNKKSKDMEDDLIFDVYDEDDDFSDIQWIRTLVMKQDRYDDTFDTTYGD